MTDRLTEAELDALVDTDTDLAQRLMMLSVHPDAASRQDVADMASALMEARRAIVQLRGPAEAAGR